MNLIHTPSHKDIAMQATPMLLQFAAPMNEAFRRFCRQASEGLNPNGTHTNLNDAAVSLTIKSTEAAREYLRSAINERGMSQADLIALAAESMALLVGVAAGKEIEDWLCSRDAFMDFINKFQKAMESAQPVAVIRLDPGHKAPEMGGE